MKAREIFIDDAGWGFPLLGVLFGIYDSQTKRVSIVKLPVKLFQSPVFEQHSYLRESGRLIGGLFQKLNIIPADTQVHICTCFVNNGISDALIDSSFTVNRTAIGEPLQSRLEQAYAEYVQQTTGRNFYYDPKELTKRGITARFFKVINWIKADNRFDIAKTGWKYFKKQHFGRCL